MTLFPGFDQHDVPTRRGPVRILTAGQGEPLLLLHGFPETHLIWHQAAPALAADFEVIAADLPGYGDSFLPSVTDDHREFSKRASAGTLLEVMAALGHQRFAVAGHDRGARIAYRMALDHPDAVRALAVLDIIPTLEMWVRADARFAQVYWHWPFLCQAAPIPELMLAAAPPQTFLSHHLTQLHADDPGYPPFLVADFQRRLQDPARLQAMCEDYRAGATIDWDHDADDREAQRRIGCPTLAVWGARGPMAQFYDDLIPIWRGWADDVRGGAIDASHFVVGDQPRAIVALLRDFLRGPSASRHAPTVAPSSNVDASPQSL